MEICVILVSKIKYDKDGNILVKTNHEIVICDFGISRPACESPDDEIYGVILYIAPEVFKEGNLTTASDIYSLGIIIWEMTSGCKPFSDRGHNSDLILKIIRGFCPNISTNMSSQFVE
ncbi:7018_t:CDS:2 [Gigaspora margarita]|uniref:7018_t:CDS:1 n=1 Tax=Gigaspora margarita TaxID=4874 RepID=A0ABN7VUT9_GIGMA|nr:7018_t:CDS:2 [Gigaspora margarita]